MLKPYNECMARDLTDGWRPGRFHIALDLMRRSFAYLSANAAVAVGTPVGSPTALIVGPTNSCNLRCDFCFHGGNDVPSERRRPQGLMSFERFASIVDQAKGWVTHIELSLFGEPTLHPRLVEMVALATDAGLSVGVFTNGVLLDSERARRLVLAGLTSVTFSMEGATSAEYERLRVGADAARVTKNLTGLLKARAELGRRQPLVIVRGLALSGMDGQKAAHARRYRELGVDQVVWLPVDNWTGSLRPPQRSVRVQPPTPRTRQCQFPWIMLCVDWDGVVLPCCEDFSARNKVGHMDDAPLREIWKGKSIQTLRQALRVRDRSRIESAAGCGGCSLLQRSSIPASAQLQLARVALGEFWGRFADAGWTFSKAPNLVNNAGDTNAGDTEKKYDVKIR